MGSAIDRRAFIKTSAKAGVGFLIVDSGILAAGKSPNEKLNVAIIGYGKRGKGNAQTVKGENIVAVCDVDESKLAAAAKEHPKAKTYIDWRQCLDQKDIEAVVCSTPDHSHAFINIWAMNRGMHVYCEKPLANSVHEARVVRETYLKNQGKVATQMGVQRHAIENMARVVELIKRGAIGAPQEVRLWCSRAPKGGDYLPEAGPPPQTLHWDLWIGPSPNHPYNPEYVGGGCLKWNRFWDFGSGQIGDMGSHVMDIAWWALDLRFPTSCMAQGTPPSQSTCPEWLTAEWEHPANDWRPAVKVYWYDGGKKPGLPSKAFNRDEMFLGALFKGDKGYLYCDFGSRYLMPTKGDMTYYHPPKPEDLIPSVPSHHEEWIAACKTGKPTRCDFDYSGALIEHNLLALAAYRVGKKLEWDAAGLSAANCPEVEPFIHKTCREGWTLNG